MHVLSEFIFSTAPLIEETLFSFVHFPQGVMMSHRNVLATASAVMTIVPALGKKDVYLAYLPLAHILELAAEVGIVCHISISIYFVASVYLY